MKNKMKLVNLHFLKCFPSVWARFVRATLDITFSFFPVFVLAFALLIDGRIDDMRKMSDVIFLAATLFAEGVWRLLCAEGEGVRLPDHDAIAIAGLVGAVFSCLLAVFMVYADGPNYPGLKTLVAKADFGHARSILSILAAVFGFVVRYKLQKDPTKKEQGHADGKA